MTKKQKKKLKILRQECLAVSLVVYGIISLIAFVFGLINADRNRGACRGKWTRIEYVLPAHRVGCWFGEVPGNNR